MPKLEVAHYQGKTPHPLTQPGHSRYAGRTTNIRGPRTVRHADIFLPVRFMRAGFTRSMRVSIHGQVERPIYLNKARRRMSVVETCPPSHWRATTTKTYGGHHA